MKIILHGGKVLTENNGIICADLLIRDGMIADIGVNFDKNCEIVDISGLTVVPGLIDTHNHGCMGTEFASADESFESGLRYLASNGITTVAPTIRCLPHQRLLRAIENVKREMQANHPGAKIAGINIEGPFLSPNRIGSMRPENLAKPERKAMREYIAAAEGTLKTMTMAPEVEGILDLVEEALAAGVNPSIGHSDASYEAAREMADAGATLVTHLYNAMPALHHRKGGTICAGFLSDAYAELIVDGIHIAPEMVKLAYTLKGSDRLVLITDSMEASGCPDGEYQIAGQPVTVKN
jgi:N-acetylglucosamine-6-phosphate deacetylase